MSYRVRKLGSSGASPVIAPTVTCHSFNSDSSLCAVCPNSSEIKIYQTNKSEDVSKWSLKYTLTEHTQVVSAIDWAPKTNRILSCSQDRNAYVWTFDSKNDSWKPTLVLLRINRAATCCKWSPKEDKFAVGSGAKLVSICYFEEENNWWVSKMIKKPHKSTILSVAWHPTDNTLVASGSSDFRCRVFSAYVKGIDAKSEKKAAFGKPIGEWVAKGWVHGVTFSPSGSRLAYVSHDSNVTVIEWESKKPTEILTKQLPMTDVIFLDEDTIAAVGYDFSPVIVQNKGGEWKCLGIGDVGDDKKKKASGGVRSAFEKFQKKTSVGSSKDTKLSTRHKNHVHTISPVEEKSGRVTKFATSGVDGRVLYWNTEDIAKKLDGFNF